MKKILLAVVALLLVAAAAFYGWLSWYGQGSLEPAFFDDEIAAFGEADRESPFEKGGIVFTGSSSIRLWTTLERDMAPLRVLNRGFGGAHTAHVLRNAERLVSAYEPEAVVIYVGDNDLGADTGKTSATVVNEFRELVAVLRANQPELRIYFISIKPSKLRAAQWPVMDRTNQAIRRLAAADPRLTLIDIGPSLRDEAGELRDDVFWMDGLHLTETGYAQWTDVVRPVLMGDLGPDAG